MFSKILGTKKENKKKGEDSILVERISKMTLSEMKLYVNDRMKELRVSEEGLQEVMLKLTKEDSKNGCYYIKADDMAVKKKKAFDLVILIAKSKKITVVSIELIQKFVEQQRDIIEAYDKEFKEIYTSRFKDAITSALATIETLSQLQTKMNTLSN
jgi:hypothetical protein